MENGSLRIIKSSYKVSRNEIVVKILLVFLALIANVVSEATTFTDIRTTKIPFLSIKRYPKWLSKFKNDLADCCQK